jgi:hypothetical protein
MAAGGSAMKPKIAALCRMLGAALLTLPLVATLAFAQTAPAPVRPDAVRPAMHIGNGHQQPTVSEVQQLEKEKVGKSASDANAPSNDKELDELYRQILKSSTPASSPLDK